MQPTFSVIVPAYNEERYLPKSLGAVNKAAAFLGEPVEVIVADNLSTDRTRDVAREFGAKVVPVSIKCISAVRNGGAAEAQGKYLVFVDADNCISEDLLVQIKQVMDSGKYIGGGLVSARYDRDALGIRLTHGLVKLGVAFTGVSMFLFYTSAEAFRTIGGYDEKLLATEDHEFAMRLRKLGKTRGQQYCNLRKGEVVLSSRKFDEYGDWMLIWHPLKWVKACFNRKDAVYELWYKPRREAPSKG